MRLGKWHQAAIYAALIAVCVSGVAWFALHDFIEEEPSEAQRNWLVIHGVAAFAALMIFGSVFPLHVRAAWSGKRNVATGLSLSSVMAILTATALCLYYGGEDIRFVARWTHIGVGLAAILILPAHVIAGRRSRKRARESKGRRFAPSVPREPVAEPASVEKIWAEADY